MGNNCKISILTLSFLGCQFYLQTLLLLFVFVHCNFWFSLNCQAKVQHFFDSYKNEMLINAKSMKNTEQMLVIEEIHDLLFYRCTSYYLVFIPES